MIPHLHRRLCLLLSRNLRLVETSTKERAVITPSLKVAALRRVTAETHPLLLDGTELECSYIIS